MRGYGPTEIRSVQTPRSGEQAALGKDLLDALGTRSAVLAGYDRGGRTACIVSANWPDRVDGLVSVEGSGGGTQHPVQVQPALGKPASRPSSTAAAAPSGECSAASKNVRQITTRYDRLAINYFAAV